jgi:UDP-3-O-[3-hydroxymyristoyl] glucosamine N-acyltransferase
MRKISVKEIVDCLGNQVLGVSGNIDKAYIDNLADMAHVNATTLDWINPSKVNKQETAEMSRAMVLLVDETIEKIEGKVLIYVKNPKRALATVGNVFFVEKPLPGVHPTAIIDKDAEIAETATIGAYAVIGNAKIGEGTIISPFVRIYDNVTIGKECFIKEGAVIGGAGFGFERDEDGNRFRFPQIGGVRIGDHVDIGGNTCIDRGALSDTILEDYAKVDNLCHIAHNVHIGKNAVVVACAEVSGSCKVGENTWIGPNACVRDQRIVGSNTMIGMGAVVVKNIPDNEVWAGNPAKKFQE